MGRGVCSFKKSIGRAFIFIIEKISPMLASVGVNRLEEAIFMIKWEYERAYF